MQSRQQIMSPHDIVILLKIVSYGEKGYLQKPLAEAVGISQSEVSKSINRSKYAGLLDPTGRKVMRVSLMEFLRYGLRYVFPQKPGPVVRGLPTSHSAPPLSALIKSTDQYVWPYAKGTMRGQSILPLYPSVPEAALYDPELYELLALVDALRVGRSRERDIAIVELQKRFRIGK